VEDIAPLIFGRVSVSCANKRTVQEALQDSRWIRDVRGNLTANGLVQCLNLLAMVSTMDRDATAVDQFFWPWSSSGQYTARSAYKPMCLGAETMEGASLDFGRRTAVSDMDCKIRCRHDSPVYKKLMI
jgi:hypothetical protein